MSDPKNTLPRAIREGSIGMPGRYLDTDVHLEVVVGVAFHRHRPVPVGRSREVRQVTSADPWNWFTADKSGVSGGQTSSGE
jgi:hypothetical protein